MSFKCSMKVCSRRPILTPQTFRSVVGIEGNEFVLKNAFVGVSNDLYVFVVVMKLRHEVSNALLNHLSLRVVIEEYRLVQPRTPK